MTKTIRCLLQIKKLRFVIENMILQYFTKFKQNFWNKSPKFILFITKTTTRWQTLIHYKIRISFYWMIDLKLKNNSKLILIKKEINHRISSSFKIKFIFSIKITIVRVSCKLPSSSIYNLQTRFYRSPASSNLITRVNDSVDFRSVKRFLSFDCVRFCRNLFCTQKSLREIQNRGNYTSSRIQYRKSKPVRGSVYKHPLFLSCTWVNVYEIRNIYWGVRKFVFFRKQRELFADAVFCFTRFGNIFSELIGTRKRVSFDTGSRPDWRVTFHFSFIFFFRAPTEIRTACQEQKSKKEFDEFILIQMSSFQIKFKVNDL